ncbi:MAG: DUF4430 domain-containing protein [Lachnospiraceae bacterium]|nr:DUF4430 domain-containing protein [Lachnospiraceae bacterium]
MKQMRIKKHLSLFLCMMLIAAMALFTTGCNDNAQTGETEQAVTTEQAATTDTAAAETTETESESEETTAGASADVQAVGEGATVFVFTVVDGEGAETVFEVHTDKTIVGEALLDCALIAGDEGEYGLYVKTVNGVTADFDTDGAYWAFYVDGEYAQSGVDTTNIEEGKTYTFKYEKS